MATEWQSAREIGKKSPSISICGDLDPGRISFQRPMSRIKRPTTTRSKSDSQSVELSNLLFCRYSRFSHYRLELSHCRFYRWHVRADRQYQLFSAANETESVRPARWVFLQEQCLSMCNRRQLATPVGIPDPLLRKWRKGADQQ